MTSMKIDWKWIIPLGAIVITGGTLLATRNAANGGRQDAERYPAPEVSVAAQRIVLPWEVALRDPQVREKLAISDGSEYGPFQPKSKKKRRKKIRTPQVEVSGAMDREMGMMAADDPDLARAEHYEPKDPSKRGQRQPEWKDWAPG
jgi:hypothetical protein